MSNGSAVCTSGSIVIPSNGVASIGGSSTSCKVSGSVVVESGGALAVNGTISVDGDLKLEGTVVLSSDGTLSIQGDLILTESSNLVFDFSTDDTGDATTTTSETSSSSTGTGGTSSTSSTSSSTTTPAAKRIVPIVVKGTVKFSGGLVMRISFSFYEQVARMLSARGTSSDAPSSNVIGGAATNSGGSSTSSATSSSGIATSSPEVQILPVVVYSSYVGAFNRLNVSTISSATSCDVYSGEPVGVYSSSTMSVALTVSRDTSKQGCQVSSGLSTGAIVGIVVGSVVGFAIIFTVIIILFRKRQLASAQKNFGRRQAEVARSSASVSTASRASMRE